MTPAQSRQRLELVNRLRELALAHSDGDDHAVGALLSAAAVVALVSGRSTEWTRESLDAILAVVEAADAQIKGRSS